MAQFKYDKIGMNSVVIGSLVNTLSELKNINFLLESTSIPDDFSQKNRIISLKNKVNDSIRIINNLNDKLNNTNRLLSNLNNELQNEILLIENYSINMRQSAIK